ncbi:hypothetical protein C6P40_002479 [Pichia californica]|uniref:Uncharacterized protein n=1 Tax=Pichia californica TaxID=460514 RepID=A0A9P7BF64_9ASCO|nr:hypothetical protein C6P42_002376 [[Candida] californica]KAG0687349.1 hypothetical protein C6P40_002479 [[Candida] californica]
MDQPDFNSDTTVNDSNNIEDELMDLFMYYVDDLCDEKIKELDSTIKLYGLLSCGITIGFVFASLLIFSVWIFSVINKGGSDNENENENDNDNEKSDGMYDYFLEHTFTPPNEEDDIISNVGVNKVYTSKWGIPQKIKDKALFWRAISRESATNVEYNGYDSLIDLYANETSKTSINNDDDDINDNDNDDINNNNKLILNELKQNDSLSDCYTTATGTETLGDSIQKSFKSGFILSSTPEQENLSDISLDNPLVFQNISLLDEDNDNIDNDDDDQHQDIRDDIKLSIQSLNKNSFSSDEYEDSSDTKVSDNEIEYNNNNSKFYSYQLSIYGPKYLITYLNKIYGNWDEFEKRVLFSQNEINNENNIGDRNVIKALKILNRKCTEDFRKDKIKKKLKTLRIAYVTETYHEIILHDIMKSDEFLFKVIKDNRVDKFVKFDIFQLFYCSFWYESEIPLTFEFTEKVIISMIEFLSFINNKCIEYKDGIRSLYDFLSYSNIEDFTEGGIFDECFKDINKYSFEKQNIIWECLKLVICQWMNECKNNNEIKFIYEILSIKINKMIQKYVEKDNCKYQEFLLIWKMLKNRFNIDNNEKEIKLSDITNNNKENEEVNCSVIKELNDVKGVNSICKVKRKLSVANRI